MLFDGSYFLTLQLVFFQGIKVVWMTHDFSFLGGSLGCAEGEKLCRGFEFAYQNQIPVVTVCRSGGARMQGMYLFIDPTSIYMLIN